MADFTGQAQADHPTNPQERMDCVRLVIISDTHSREAAIPHIPYGDVLIHAGDFSNVGALHEVTAFRAFMDAQPHAQVRGPHPHSHPSLPHTHTPNP
jgi:3',5'-cyclic AMP phosphodiesterase CpdA